MKFYIEIRDENNNLIANEEEQKNIPDTYVFKVINSTSFGKVYQSLVYSLPLLIYPHYEFERYYLRCQLLNKDKGEIYLIRPSLIKCKGDQMIKIPFEPMSMEDFNILYERSKYDKTNYTGDYY